MANWVQKRYMEVLLGEGHPPRERPVVNVTVQGDANPETLALIKAQATEAIHGRRLVHHAAGHVSFDGNSRVSDFGDALKYAVQAMGDTDRPPATETIHGKRASGFVVDELAHSFTLGCDLAEGQDKNAMTWVTFPRFTERIVHNNMRRMARDDGMHALMVQLDPRAPDVTDTDGVRLSDLPGLEKKPPTGGYLIPVPDPAGGFGSIHFDTIEEVNAWVSARRAKVAPSTAKPAISGLTTTAPETNRFGGWGVTD